jgi:hypothetical protein
MQKIFIYIITAFFLLSSVSLAIDKTSGKKVQHKKVDTLIKIESPEGVSPSGSDPGLNTNEKLGNRRDYNDFIDRNSNGIDDRAENKKKVEADKLKTDTQDQVKTKSKSTEKTKKR